MVKNILDTQRRRICISVLVCHMLNGFEILSDSLVVIISLNSWSFISVIRTLPPSSLSIPMEEFYFIILLWICHKLGF